MRRRHPALETLYARIVMTGGDGLDMGIRMVQQETLKRRVREGGRRWDLSGRE